MRRRVNVWGNLISMHLEPNESEPNAFEGRADSSISPWYRFSNTIELLVSQVNNKD